ncbi:hypothetical protein TL16_g13330 [Triparma laevis f. inornata]|uniref:Uncharacterized protein n=1 Tax=Triparma laevis f. inornata TaxID=1714386 RepID=A0A9W7BUI2_9STRA|nr:hypothetical protein TL16_g13330 [Triparma laevis f. inornata]
MLRLHLLSLLLLLLLLLLLVFVWPKGLFTRLTPIICITFRIFREFPVVFSFLLFLIFLHFLLFLFVQLFHLFILFILFLLVHSFLVFRHATILILILPPFRGFFIRFIIE